MPRIKLHYLLLYKRDFSHSVIRLMTNVVNVAVSRRAVFKAAERD